MTQVHWMILLESYTSRWMAFIRPRWSHLVHYVGFCSFLWFGLQILYYKIGNLIFFTEAFSDWTSVTEPRNFPILNRRMKQTFKKFFAKDP